MSIQRFLTLKIGEPGSRICLGSKVNFHAEQFHIFAYIRGLGRHRTSTLKVHSKLQSQTNYVFFFSLPSNSIHSPPRPFNLLLTKPSFFSTPHKLFLPKLCYSKWDTAWVHSPLPYQNLKLLTLSLIPSSLFHHSSVIPSFCARYHYLFPSNTLTSTKPCNLIIQWP